MKMDELREAFVFDGRLGLHQVKYDSGGIGEVEVIQTSSGLEFLDEDRDRHTLNHDGTFDGGRIVRRV